MKGDITQKILEVATKLVLAPIEIAWAIAAAGYGASLGEIEREARKFREVGPAHTNIDARARKNYRNLLYKLEKDGLVIQKKRDDKRILVVTKRGLIKLFALRKKGNKTFSPPSRYVSEKSENIIIVSFDVPEKERWKRDWLRGVLDHLGLKRIQRSLCVGKIKIPREFLEDIKKFGMLDWVEIFEVSKTGTLKHVS